MKTSDKIHEAGKAAEDYTAEFLLKHGYRIAGRNMRDSYRETDIIAVKNRTVCFVEVKAGKSFNPDAPENRVTMRKMLNIKAAAQHYAEKLRMNGVIPEMLEFRFDVAAVKYSDGFVAEEFTYYENFYKVDENEIF